MNRILICLGATIALALAGCAHYPTGDQVADDGGSCGPCPDGQTCVDGACTAAPDGGGNPDGGMVMTDGGTGGGSDGGAGGMDGGSGGSDGGSCGTCPEGTTCVDGTCVCDGDGDDGSDHSCQAGKTLLCHYPPGNPANRHDICVGDPAVPAHLAHGDSLGTCP